VTLFTLLCKDATTSRYGDDCAVPMPSLRAAAAAAAAAMVMPRCSLYDTSTASDALPASRDARIYTKCITIVLTFRNVNKSIVDSRLCPLPQCRTLMNSTSVFVRLPAGTATWQTSSKDNVVFARQRSACCGPIFNYSFWERVLEESSLILEIYSI